MQQKFYYAIFKKKHLSLFMLALLCSVWAFGQTNKVTGKVTDEGGNTLPGVTVSIKGTSTGMATGINGDFTLNAAPDAILVFKLIGYQPQEVTVGNKSIVNITLKSQAVGLNEVTVAYGKQLAREVTGSAPQIKANFEDQPVMQFGQELQGKVAGVQVSQTSGQPGRGIAFRIRGAASFTTDYQPLYVIDGLPITGSVNNINPDEIESFTFLKDASASALYGSRAANGVVLITTKHAKPGDAKVTYSSNIGVQKLPGNKVPKMMNATQFATFMQQRYQDKVTYEGFAPGSIPAEYQGDVSRWGEGTNWFNLLTQSAPIQSHTLSVLSAREKSSSAVIVGYEAQDGVLVNTGTQLFSLRINQDLTLGSKNQVKIGFNVAPSYRKDHNNRLATDGVGGYYERLFEASPLVSPFNPDGSYTTNSTSPGMVNYANPLAQLKETRDDYVTNRLLGNGYINYEFLPGLSLHTNLGVDKASEARNNFVPSVTSLNAASLSTGVSSSVDNYSYTAESTLNFEKTFLTNHHIDALIGYSAQKFDQKSNSVSGTGYPADDIPYLSQATSITAGTSGTTQYSLLSAIARVNYSYKGRYLLSGSVRRDGSSRFGADRLYGYFPSASVGWVMSDETFMQKFKSVDLLKVRASYGVTGNNFFGNYLAQSTIGNYNYTLGGALASGQTVNVLGNTNLEWERNQQLDIGLDLSLFHNRVNFTYDYYHKNSDHLILTRPIPRASGFSNILDNVGNIEYWGHEFTVNTINLTGKLKWNTDFNISVDRNLIKTLVSPGYLRRNNTVSSDYYRNQEGHHLGEFYGFVYLGLYKDAADLANSPKYVQGSFFSDIGTIKVKDINGDGVVDDNNDRTFIGDPTPKFTFGLTNSFKYSNFDLSVSMAGSVGGKILAAAKWAYLTNMDGSRLLLAAALDHWRSIDNPGSGVYPRTLANTTALGREVNSQWVENGSYLTAKNITLGYNFKLKDNLLLKNLRLYASVQQAFIITGYSGANPEIALSGLDATSGIGVDENGFPVPRTFSIGISTSFK